MIIGRNDKIAIYTAVIGNYDKEIVASKNIDDNMDLFLYTDNYLIKSIDRKIIHVEKQINDNTKSARYIKIISPERIHTYKYSLWIDGHVSIIGNIRDLINNNIIADEFTGIAMMGHPERMCLYDEANYCIDMKKDHKSIINDQINRYKSEGFPNDYGLARTTVIFRESDNNNVHKLMEYWWNEVINGSCRDQISFNYSVWKNNCIYNHLNPYLFLKYFKQHRCHVAHI